MAPDDAAVVYRPTPTVRTVFGTVVPLGLAAIGLLVLALGGDWLYTAAYFTVAVLLARGVRRAQLEVGPAGLTRTLVRRRFVPWSVVDHVSDAGTVRLRDGQTLSLRPSGDDRSQVARVVRAVHLAVLQHAVVAIRRPELGPDVQRQLARR